MKNDTRKGIIASDEEMPEVENVLVGNEAPNDLDKTSVKEYKNNKLKDFFKYLYSYSISFYKNKLAPKIPLFNKFFLSFCGMVFVFLVFLGLYSVYETNLFLGLLVNLMLIFWILKVGKYLILDIFYKLLQSTITFLTSFKENIDNKNLMGLKNEYKKSTF